MSNQWELYVTAKLLTFNNFQTYEGSQYFSPDLREKNSLLIGFQTKVE